jgi:RNA polymerase sigma-70 factor (ECF subfamily)
VNDISPVTEPVRIAVSRRGSSAVADFIAAAYDEHEARIHGMLLGATRDPELAADITQEAFLRLLAEARAGRLPAAPGAWLYRTASNLVISRARRESVARRFAPRLLRRDDTAGPESMAVEHERSRSMSDILARLPIADRTALIMAAQGLSGEDIAAALGKSHGATRTLLFRARERLRQAMVEPEDQR